VARLDAETAGPRWAWAIAGVPVIGWIGDAAIAMVAWRRRWQWFRGAFRSRILGPASAF
jgi:predicted DCC family thiol-disulfide oxidoreductase YuxK